MFQAIFAVLTATFFIVGSGHYSFNSLENELFSGNYFLVDLTHAVDVRTNVWPGSRPFEFTSQFAGRVNNVWLSSNDFCIGEHGGTHLDAPYHFNIDGETVGYIPITKLVVSLLVIDLSDRVNDNPDYVLTAEELGDRLDVCNDPGKQYLVIFKFGWSKYYYDRKKFLGNNGSSVVGLNFPGLDGSVADLITANYPNIVGVGVDTASVDAAGPTRKGSPVHVTLTAHRLYMLENVNIQKNLPDGCIALALPMKILFGTGAPVRLVAICPY